MKKTLVIVGGGPSGVMAAISAARQSEGRLDILLLEKNERCLKKLLLTGNGRCNITNAADTQAMADAFGNGRRFIKSSLKTFPGTALKTFFEDRGLPIVSQPDGRCFPASGKARDVADVLLNETIASGVTIMIGENVVKVETCGRGKYRITTHANTYEANSVIISTGGRSYPATGSSGDGYGIAASFGHSISPLNPAISPIMIDNEAHAGFVPLSFADASITVWSDSRKAAEYRGGLIFIPNGLSGPAALNASMTVARLLSAGGRVRVAVSLFPDIKEEDMDTQLQGKFSRFGGVPAGRVLYGMLPERAISALIAYCGIAPATIVAQMPKSDRRKISRAMTGLMFDVAEVGGFEAAMLTSGGVDLGEITPSTLESKISAGLFFCGEVLDLQAPTGGFNLQCAFSTGYLAGKAAVGKLL